MNKKLLWSVFGIGVAHWITSLIGFIVSLVPASDNYESSVTSHTAAPSSIMQSLSGSQMTFVLLFVILGIVGFLLAVYALLQPKVTIQTNYGVIVAMLGFVSPVLFFFVLIVPVVVMSVALVFLLLALLRKQAA